MWKYLDHPNIVAFKGVTLNPLQLVSEWMPGGELQEHLKKHPNANPISLVGPFLSTSALHLTPPSPQLIGIAEGLAYLHSSDVIHGDLKGVRVINHPGSFFLEETGTGKHRDGRVRKRTNHGFWSRERGPGSEFGGEHFRQWRLLTPVDCT